MTFMENTNLNIRVDKDVKAAAEKIFDELGLTMSTAVNIFLRQTIRENGIPFALRLSAPNSVIDHNDEEEDPKFAESVRVAIESGKISTSLLQRRLGLGYGRAAKIIDRMEEMGIVSAPDGQKQRDVLISMQEFREMMGKGEE